MSFLSRKKSAGFSLVELLVIVAITMTIGGSIFASYRQGQREAEVRDTVANMVSMLRRAQSASQSGMRHQGNATTHYKLSVNESDPAYYLCAVVAGDIETISCPPNRIVETGYIPSKVNISSISFIPAGSGSGGLGLLAVEGDVAFKNPFADITFISDATDSTFKGTMIISIEGRGASNRILVDSLSGTINVQ